ncbi:MAG: ATP-binding protein [bacterium]
MKAQGLKRKLYAFFSWTSLIAYIGGSSNYLPAFNIHLYPFTPFGTYAAPLYMVAISYSIIKHQLIDTELVITRATVFTFFYGITFGLPFVLFSLFNKQIYPIYHNNPWAIPVSIVGYAAFAAISPFLYMRLEQKAYHTFFGDYSAQLKILTETSRDIIEKGFENPVELARLIPTHIINFYEKTMGQKISHAFYLLSQKGYFTLHHGATKCDTHIEGMEIGGQHSLITWFKETRKNLIEKNIIKDADKDDHILEEEKLKDLIQEITISQSDNVLEQKLKKMLEDMKRLAGVIFFPSFYKDELMGILALGEKKGGYYRQEEIETLRALAKNAALVFKGSQLTASVVEAEQIKEMERLKSEFFSNVSHELRTPLNNILPPVESLLYDNKKGFKPELVKRTLNTVLANGKRLLLQVNKLLDLAKWDAGKMKLNYSLAGVHELLKDVIDPARELAGIKKIKIIEDYAPDLSPVYVDINYLDSAFSNLLNNALKFTGETGQIKIKTMEAKDYIKITISDTGIGIDKHDLPYIFDRFRQADGSSTRKFGGTGIGLSLAKNIIELHEGTIEVESTKGKGTTFTIGLPRTERYVITDKEESIKKEQRSGKDRRDKLSELTGRRKKDKVLDYGASLEYADLVYDTEEKVDGIVPKVERQSLSEAKYKILIVEDDKNSSAVLNSLLNPLYIISSAENGRQALELIKKDQTHLIISDVMMPEMDGYELCKHLKSDYNTAFIPIILLTAKAEIEDKIIGIEYGADKYMSKPFNYRELLASVSVLIKQGELKRDLQNKNEELEKAIIELKETEMHLVHSAKLASVGELAAGVAHEINNPAFAVDNCFDVMLDNIDEMKNENKNFASVYPELIKFATLGKKSINRIRDIVDALLGFSRKNREGLHLVDIHKGIDDTLTILGHQFKDRIQVHKEYGQFEEIETDLQQLNQVFMNVLTNAIYAIEAKKEKGIECGHVLIKTCKEGEYINIIIQDDGIGISKDIQGKIFDAFFTTKEVGKGTGLGLNLSYRIITDLHGTIGVESKENEGAGFTIKLPCVMNLKQTKGGLA